MAHGREKVRGGVGQIFRPTDLRPVLGGAVVQAELQRFFASYREAFNRLDPEAISRHFCVPSVMTSHAGDAIWADASQIRANMVALCEHYRTHGFVAAEFELRAFIDQPPDHAVADLQWTIRRSGARPSSRFRTGYNLRRESSGWRVLLCTAYEEDPLNG